MSGRNSSTRSRARDGRLAPAKVLDASAAHSVALPPGRGPRGVPNLVAIVAGHCRVRPASVLLRTRCGDPWCCVRLTSEAHLVEATPGAFRQLPRGDVLGLGHSAPHSPEPSPPGRAWTHAPSSNHVAGSHARRRRRGRLGGSGFASSAASSGTRSRTSSGISGQPPSGGGVGESETATSSSPGHSTATTCQNTYRACCVRWSGSTRPRPDPSSGPLSGSPPATTATRAP